MINRRLIRIKTFQALYAYNSVPKKSISNAKKELSHSIIKTLDLYFLLLQLSIDVKDYAFQKIENNKAKHLANDEDLNPNTLFINNLFLLQLEKNEQFNNYCKAQKLSWTDHSGFIKNLYNTLISSDVYKKYMSEEKNTYKTDKKFITLFYEEILGNSEEIIKLLEEESIYWTEDFEFVINVLLKTIRTFKKSDTNDKTLIELYKNDDDKKFAEDLLEATISSHDNNIQLIEKFTKNWEIDRIIQIDVLLMEMSITEFTNFPSIPIKVTLDEYIELSKFYSSPKSKIFINGVLDKIIGYLKENNRIIKKGRGLIGQV